MQTVCVSVLPEEKLLGLAYFIAENDILSGRKAFCLGMTDCYFLRFRLSVDLLLEPFGELPKPNIGSLTQQTWSIRQKLNRVIMEAMNTSSLICPTRGTKQLTSQGGNGLILLGGSLQI
jgi:hypothetical protein